VALHFFDVRIWISLCIEPFPSIERTVDTDRKEYDASSNSAIVACVFFAR
jgi:hypothetical protein